MSLRKHERLYKLVSCATLFGFILPLLAGLGTPKRAEAQVAAPMPVGVVEFLNDSNVQGTMLARLATDAVVIELSKSDRFDVVTRAQIDARMKDLNIAPPLNATERSRLGEALAVEAMIDGNIKDVEIRGSGSARKATVTLVVRMIDQASGEVINGAIQTGQSIVRVGGEVDDDKLISEAINNAAYQAVKTMIDYIIPEATVQNTIRTNEVMLNKGARDGIRTGMKMIVTRDREIIGKVSVQHVDPNNSIAAVVSQTRGISPEDKARAVFDMPGLGSVADDPGSKTGQKSSVRKAGGSFIKSLSKVVVPVLVAAFVGGMYHSGTAEKVGAVTAEAGLSGYDLPTESGGPGVRIRWNPNKLGKGLNVVEYHIWRNDFSKPVLVGLPTDGEVFDDGLERDISIRTPEVNDGQPDGLNSESVSVPAISTGKPLKYYVSAVYSVVGKESILYYETVRQPTGQVTPIAQIPISGMRGPLTGSQQNLHKVTFEWLSKRGADTYIVEASTDPTFRNPEFVSRPISFSSVEGQLVRLEVTTSLYNLFQMLPSEQPIWWRVGARASTDSPGPIPANGRENMRYIYSEINHFYPVEMPPVPPG